MREQCYTEYVIKYVLYAILSLTQQTHNSCLISMV